MIKIGVQVVFWKWYSGSRLDELEGLSGSRDGFLSSGVTAAHLNLDGKTPPENGKLESLAIISEKTEGQCFSSLIVNKSAIANSGIHE